MPEETKTPPVKKTEAEWRELLSPEQFHVMREKGTEPPFTGKLNKVYDDGIYRCAVSVAGVSDVSAIMASDGDNGDYPSGRYDQKLFGVKSASDSALKRISPLLHPDQASAPILLIHGKDDTVVPFVHSLTMSDALTKAGKTGQLIALDSEDHFLSREVTRVQTLEASVNWVEKYNPVDP